MNCGNCSSALPNSTEQERKNKTPAEITGRILRRQNVIWQLGLDTGLDMPNEWSGLDFISHSKPSTTVSPCIMIQHRFSTDSCPDSAKYLSRCLSVIIQQSTSVGHKQVLDVEHLHMCFSESRPQRNITCCITNTTFLHLLEFSLVIDPTFTL